MPRILCFRIELLPLSETFIASQAGALRRFEPVFAGLRRVPSGLPLDAFRVTALTEGNTLMDRLKRRAWLHSGFSPAFERTLRGSRPVLLHAHFAVDAAIALPLCRRLGLPLVVTLHGYDVTRSDEALRCSAPGRIFLHRRQRLFEQASLFLCVSDHIRQRAIERGFPAERLLTHRIGVDLSLFSPGPSADREPVVLFVGRLVEKKGCAHLIEAMAQVQCARPEARLVLIGDGPLRVPLEAQARQSLRNVVFLGSQPAEEVRAWMRRARLLAAPSIVAADGDSEGLPVVLCEAQAMGLPVVGYRGPGVSEAVENDETGLLVEPGNPQALAAAIGTFLRDAALASMIGHAGRRRAERFFDLQAQTAILEETYAALSEGGAPQ
ncbi:glycosyltransferase [Paracidobacterium acidisoli]|nr:glycosyltransferase [Paracidobacterium acidisoli]MBT9329476.1 glycosyltransferase [Paracidobacterium acidisoli]